MTGLKCLLPILLLALGIPMHSQDCTLGIDGADSEIIIQVFALDSVQQERLATYAKALRTENGLLEEKATALLESHPQDSPESLAALGVKYGEIKDQMVENAARYDRMLLGHFHPKQLALYQQLCQEVLRKPMIPILPKDPPEQEE